MEDSMVHVVHDSKLHTRSRWLRRTYLTLGESMELSRLYRTDQFVIRIKCTAIKSLTNTVAVLITQAPVFYCAAIYVTLGRALVISV
jgi:hypothetical protein